MPPSCRLCQSPLPDPFLDLGHQPLSNAYLSKAELVAKAEWTYPLRVRICHHCLLVQVDDAISAADIFNKDYAYFSSFSDSWLAHCKSYVQTAIKRFDLGPHSQVVEIASNDGYLLQFFAEAGISVLGIEPTASTAAVARKRKIPTEERFFNRALGRDLAARGIKADLIHGANVLAHVPDIADFLAGFPFVLKSEGTLTLEFPHLLKLIEYVQFDTIYHEHFSYLSLLVVENALAYAGLMVFDLEELPTHGGSLRLYCAHAKAARAVMPAVEAVRTAEKTALLNRMETYTHFSGEVEKLLNGFIDFLAKARRERKRIAAYGAAAKGNTFLNTCGVSTNDIICVFDRNPYKQGKYLPGSHLPILSPDQIETIRPDYLLILPWNLRGEIVEQLAFIKDWGGRFVTAAPFLDILD